MLDLFSHAGAEIRWPRPGALHPGVWYRAFFESYDHRDPCIWFATYPVMTRTAKGVWLNTSGWSSEPVGKRFVLNSSKKAFAHSTPEAAVRGLLFRRRSYVSRLTQQLDEAQEQLKAFEAAFSLKMKGAVR